LSRVVASILTISVWPTRSQMSSTGGQYKSMPFY